MNTFRTFGVKLYAPRRACQDVLKASAGRRFEHCSYFVVELSLACRVYPEVLKTSAGRQFGHFSLGRGCTHDSAGLRGHERSLRTAADFSHARYVRPSCARLNRVWWFTSPKSLDRVLEFLFYLGAHVSGLVFFRPKCLKHLPAHVLALTPLREKS